MGYNAGRTLRAFLAFSLPEGLAGHLADVQRMIADRGIGLKWVRPGNIHLTVKFFGDISTAEVDRLGRVVTETVKRTALTVPPVLMLRGLGVFPGWKRPRVLWAGLAGDTGLLRALQADLDQALAAAGFKPDTRPFKAHLTIGRVRQAVDSRALADAVAACGEFPKVSWPLHELVLYQSELKPAGAVYTVLKRFPLAGQGAGSDAS